MALAQTLNCKKRELKTKGHRNELKRNEWVPAVLYGKGQPSVPITLGQRELIRVFNQYGSRGLFSLNIEDEKEPVIALIREIQKKPVSGDVVHIDFLTVDMTEKLTSTVSVYILGDEEVIKKGAVLQSGAKEVEVSCLPADLPDYISCDVSNLNIGDKVTVADLEVPEGVELLTDPESQVAAILAPAKAEEEETEEGEEATEEDAAEENNEE
ncbi:LSU ribosomal protein L25p [Candidatus Syntrophocurvum alkaliphilum]|uniref:Large ribosomal subunit protein bL25 n=1 Tax=Candidatus Syntrophocurvum alkaliphilum TaxID=2293317 RepID=A0A6I6DKV8_9FIRM|nr:50S ribosomal protein L25 [Candidatus Syntrophocurvum alkaliphilum]QGU00540.1 LSU ribosomal protein L25p [Candidatus Syntrophocurvum alkaliphilum]